MNNLKYLAAVFGICFSAAAFGQPGEKAKDDLKEKQQSERDRSFGGQKDEPSTQYRNITKDSTSDSESKEDNDNQGKAPANDLNHSNGLAEENNGSGAPERKANASPVIERTSSESGSAAMPASQDGKDGTNTMQRARPNMAGAKEPGNLHLAEKNKGGKNINTGNNRVKRPEETPVQKSTKDSQPATKNQKTVVSDGAKETSTNTKIAADKEKSKKVSRRERRKKKQ